jgi:DNA repair protein RecO
VIDIEGIILREVKILGGKNLLNVLTASEGKITVSARARKSKKNSSGVALSPLSVSKLSLEKRGERYYLKTAAPISDSFALAADYDKYLLASKATQIIDKLIPEGGKSEIIFICLKAYLLALPKAQDASNLAARFYRKILEIEGAGVDEVEAEEQNLGALEMRLMSIL